jgi:hypothetical protein
VKNLWKTFFSLQFPGNYYYFVFLSMYLCAAAADDDNFFKLKIARKFQIWFEQIHAHTHKTIINLIYRIILLIIVNSLIHVFLNGCNFRCLLLENFEVLHTQIRQRRRNEDSDEIEKKKKISIMFQHLCNWHFSCLFSLPMTQLFQWFWNHARIPIW